MPQCFRWRAALLVAVVGLLLAPSARAEPGSERAVVFVEPASDELARALRDALTAQLSGASALLVFERFAADGATLRHQVAEARSLAHAHDALGVFWLDAQSDRDWLIYLAEPDGDRVLVRRLTLETGGTAAAVEAVAVITRQSSDALLAGQTIGMRPVNLPPEPEQRARERASDVSRASTREASAATLRAPDGVALALAYYGDSFARQAAWQSGALFSASFRFSVGLYGGVGYVLNREIDVAASDLTFRISRAPIHLEMGWSFGHGRLVPSFGLRGIFDVVSRQVVSAGALLQRAPDETRALIFLSPRVRFDYSVYSVLGVYLGGGMDLALNRFSFVSRIDGKDRVLLEPTSVRPSIELGLTFWP